MSSLNDDLQQLEQIEDEEWERQRRIKRKQRIEEMKRRKAKAQMIHRCVMAAAVVVLLIAGLGIGSVIRSAAVRGKEPAENDGQNTGVNMADGSTGDTEDIGDTRDAGDMRVLSPHALVDSYGQTGVPQNDLHATPESPASVFTATTTEHTANFSDTIVSEYGILVDVEAGTILAGKDAMTRMNPASMTKILTVLTAAEALGVEDDTSEILDDTITFTLDITDYCFVNDCSVVGYELGETATVRDLFYGTILPSGAETALGLAIYVAGSHEAFVEMMNQKLEKMGLSETTHFTNCVGIYDEQHYSTAYDIAVILEEASKNEFCRQVLSAHTYNTTYTEEHPEGMMISNLFLRRIEDRDTHGEVICGKTGYVSRAGHCAASLATDVNGREYLCVTAGSSSVWQCIRDQVELYQSYLTGLAEDV